MYIITSTFYLIYLNIYISLLYTLPNKNFKSKVDNKNVFIMNKLIRSY